MRRKITILVVAAIAVLGLFGGGPRRGGILSVQQPAAAASPTIGSETPGGGLTGTVHDFTNGFSTYANTAVVGECTFCHTPHGAISTSLLWNHELSGLTYSWDTTATMAGTPFPTFADTAWAGPTAKCLSCHDGTVAIGSVNWFNSGHGGAGAWTGTPKASPYGTNPLNNGHASLQGLSNNSSSATPDGSSPGRVPLSL